MPLLWGTVTKYTFYGEQAIQNTDDDADLLHVVLKLPWTHSLMVAEPHHPWKTKCISVQVASKLGPSLKTETDLKILDFSFHDEVEEVRVEAVLSMPVIVLWSGLGLLMHIFRRLELLGKEKNEKVKNIIPLTPGFLSCLYGSCNAVDGLSKSTSKLFLNINNEKHSQTVDYLLQGFWCSKCDRSIAHNPELYSQIIHQPDMQRTEISLDCDFLHLQSLFFKLLYDESSEEVQVACVGVIRRILIHGNTDVLLKTRSEWTKYTSLQQQALKHIEMLIKMMGSHLSTYVPKLMVLLMHAIDKEPLQSEGLSILHFFIEQLAKVSLSSTKHVISQVFAALIPFLEREKEHPSNNLDKVVKILKELVLKNKVVLKEHIREFPPLPSIPALTEVNKAIQEACGSMTLKDQLRDVVDGLNHENLNVCYMVVCELSKLLNLRREEVTALITAEAHSDMDVLSSLITSLLRGCAEESRTAVGQRLKLVCADCLGALGAVDPAKVKGFTCQRFKIECSDDDLIFELIHKHLARAFRAAPDTIIQDSAALAILEILKIAGCEASMDASAAASMSQKLKDKKSLDNRRGQKLWDRFSNYVKEIIASCLTSRFQLPNVADSACTGPIYRPKMSFRRWIFNWIRKLAMHATGSRASIFNACRGIVRHDMQTAIYLLPYLVLEAVCHGSEEARHSITEEILSVLDAAVSENSGATVHGVSGGQSEVCIQAVFTLLDNLGQWVDDVEQELALSQSFQSSASKQQSSKSKDQSPTSLIDQEQLLVQCKYVSELLTAIPKVILARASFRCQAYARSLMYFESHVRVQSGSFNPAAERSGVFEDEDVSYLMEIYSWLDEPDGLSGLACLRKS
ncbi:hypothetical protein CMV_029205 [Castanea mollissima]|uniref:non-specific serine/threonine protein kinase n=1 Tax=Castanea mollissima TaxID=60419 RepID=A0A8J4QBV5_9ROSI|nr:hypothetical protein CMV_029205 [Castanea mollissima]